MKKLYGNAVVGQSGGPTAAINATLAGVIRGVLEDVGEGAIKTLYGMRNGVEGLLEERLVNLNELFAREENIEMLEHTPAAALGSCRKKLPKPGENDAVYEKLLSIFQKYDIRYFFYIGGNDSMDTVAKLSAYTKEHDYEMCIMGVPKTIDNDLVVTDHTPGFGSAAKYIAVTVQEIIRDCAVYTVPAVTIVEIMGRDAGWLTAASGIGLAVNGIVPDLIYLPERAFDKDEFFEDVRAALKKHPNVVIAVSEGIRFADGTYVCEGFGIASVDAFGHKQLSGTGKALEVAVKNELGCKVRSVELNISQRCAAHIASETDLAESVSVGRAAVKAASEGVTREMMVIVRDSTEPYRYHVDHSDVSRIANQIKKVPAVYINERGNHITAECAEYLLPLIAGEAAPRYRSGLPAFFVIE
ncbi:MAG: 6-phosphofructokinase [Ruminococcaceae bacterium]|nr:6-phosphofructokinase [Oscillospiraceae bacterium]